MFYLYSFSDRLLIYLSNVAEGMNFACSPSTMQFSLTVTVKELTVMYSKELAINVI